MTRPTRPPSHRRRALAGLVLAAALAAGLVHVVHTALRTGEESSRAERAAIIHARALTGLLERAGTSGDPARAVVSRWAAEHPTLRSIRVVRLQGITLEASTAAADEGELAAPRRLGREEKELYDQAQRLRAAVETNREEGVPRKEEIELLAAPGRRLTVAIPFEEEGAVAGMVILDMAAEPPTRGGFPLAPVAAFLVPVLAFLALSRAIGERRVLAFGITATLLLGATAIHGVLAARDLLGARHASTLASAGIVARDAALAGALPAELRGPGPAPLAPETWDSDVYRRPRGQITAAGEVEARALAPELLRLTRQARRSVMAAGLVSLALLAFVALGGAARVGTALARNRQAYLYVLPAMLGMIVLVFFPFIYGIALSFTDATIYNTDKSIPEIWVGLRNYIEILGDFAIVKQTAGGLVFNYLNFYWTLLFTIVWTVTNVTLGVTSGLVLALILNTKGLVLRPIYRVLLILPWAMPNYITALIWKGMFHQQFGVINQAIQIFGGPPVSWFETPFTSYLTALTTNGWLSFPFMMVVALGALQSISAELYEAARIDGATRWQMFRSITLPSLRPALIPAIILSVIWTFNMFNIIYLVTQGEPGSATEILITQSYKFAFEKYRYGYAAAYSTVIFLILLVYGVIQNRATRATEAIST
jgi:arabinogalactan oligomer/maltooligosaccharide transport system permease protein